MELFCFPFFISLITLSIKLSTKLLGWAEDEEELLLVEGLTGTFVELVDVLFVVEAFVVVEFPFLGL